MLILSFSLVVVLFLGFTDSKIGKTRDLYSYQINIFNTFDSLILALW